MFRSRRPLKKGQKRTPVFIQMEVTECGAASLGMILGYYGKHVSLNELRMVCGVSRDGCNAHDILEAAEEYGMEGCGYALDVEELMEERSPLIVFWEFKHFVVLEGFGRDSAYLNDPAMGPREVSMEDFRKGYTGIVLEVTPGKNFKKGGMRPSLLRGIWEGILVEKRTFAFLVTISLLLALMQLIWGASVQFFLDHLFPQLEDLFHWGFAAAVTGIFLAEVLLSSLEHSYLARLNMKLRSSLNSEFYWKLLSLPMRFYEQRHSGELAHRQSLNDEVAATMAHQLLSTMVQLALAGVYLTLIFSFHTLIGIMATATFFLTLGLHVALHHKRKNAHACLAQEFGKYEGTAISGILSIESIKVGGREGNFFHRLVGLHAHTINALQQLQLYDKYLIAFTGMINGLALVTLLTVGAWGVFEGTLTIGMLYFLKILLEGFTRPVLTLATLSDEIQRLEVTIYRLSDVVSGENDPATTHTLSRSTPECVQSFNENPQLRGRLMVNDLCFGYASRKEPLIKNLSFELHPGQIVALSGLSSAGKSTLMRLLAGLYQPWSGEILVDGYNREAIPRELISNSVSLIRQKPFLFKGSVRENLTLFDTSIHDPFMIEAAKIAQIHDVIVSRPHDYDGEVMEAGINFSGGQRQRLDIARALVKRPRILLIDEGTSGLEESMETQIVRELKRLGITCLIATQRYSTAALCDEVLVINDGHIQQRGKHEELLKQPGLYKDLAEKGEIA